MLGAVRLNLLHRRKSITAFGRKHSSQNQFWLKWKTPKQKNDLACRCKEPSCTNIRAEEEESSSIKTFHRLTGTIIAPGKCLVLWLHYLDIVLPFPTGWRWSWLRGQSQAISESTPLHLSKKGKACSPNEWLLRKWFGNSNTMLPAGHVSTQADLCGSQRAQPKRMTNGFIDDC